MVVHLNTVHGAGRLADSRLNHMQEVLAGYVERGAVPGLVAAVCRRGEAHVLPMGAKSLGGEPVARDTIFRISSMSKPITAVATMILIEDCVLRLDDPVERWLPELANRQVLRRIDGPLDDTVPAKRPITVRDLLTFCMGFGLIMTPDAGSYPAQIALDALNLGQGMPGPAAPPDPDEWITRFSSLPLLHQPGERWMYNTGSDVLSVLIARASGLPFEEFLRTRLFGPLGMVDTGFHVPAEKQDRFVTSYLTDPASGALHPYDDPTTGQWSSAPAFPSGAGGLVSTIDDYLAFGEMLLNMGAHGKERILSRPSVELMTSDQLSAEQKRHAGFGFEAPGEFRYGFGVSVTGEKRAVDGSPGTFGWNGGLGTIWNSDPREEMTAILLTQAAWTSPSPPPICLDFMTLAYSAIDD